MSFKGRSIISVNELSSQDMEHIMRTSATIEEAVSEKDSGKYKVLHSDTMIATLFFEPSTRTRGSFERAIRLLGGFPDGFPTPEGSSVKKGESLRHTLEMYAGYGADAIVMRHPLDGAARWGSEVMIKRAERDKTKILPVINAGDGKHEHPTQTILDRYSILKAAGRLTDDCDHPYSLEGLNILMANDLLFGRVPHSDVMDFAQDGVNFIFVAPEMFQMPESYLRHIERKGSTFEKHDRLEDAVLAEADVVMMFRPQKERFSTDALKMLAKIEKDFVITKKHIKAMKEGAVLMHPLPTPKWSPEMAPEVDDMPEAYYFAQAATGVPTRMAELALVLGYMRKEYPSPRDSLPTGEETFWTERIPTQDSQSEKDEHDYNLHPIRDRGVAIDHLPMGVADEIGDLLLDKGAEFYRGGNVRRKRDRSLGKSMLLIEDRFLTPEELKIVAAIAGGSGNGEKVTVNEIDNGRVIRKLDLSLPPSIEGIGTCSNIVYDGNGEPKGGCITHPVFEEHVPPRFLKEDEHSMRCLYCDNIMNSRELFK